MDGETYKFFNISTSNPFYGKWKKIISNTSAVFNLNQEEKTALYVDPVAQLITAIPYLAGCEDPTRTALAHLSGYLLAVRTNKIFEYVIEQNNTVFNQLSLINNWLGGNREIIERGMNLLTLHFLCNSCQEVDDPVKSKKLLPDTIPDHKKKISELLKKIKSIDCPYMDEILSSETIIQSV